MSAVVQSKSAKWQILALATITGTFVTAIPFSCMPSLFKEMSQDLGLSLVQIGSVWGAGSLAALVICFFGGFLGDRFGVKKILVWSCILVGVTGALRGFSNSFFTLAAFVFLNSLVRSIIPIIIVKMTGVWFRDNLALANGISAGGMGLGLMLGPLVSATVLSPALGGWRNVMFFLGALSLLVGLLWLFFGKDAPTTAAAKIQSSRVTMGQALKRLVRLRALWLTGVTIMARSACISGMVGFLPLYLRDRGWTPASADGALSTFYAASTLCVVPLSLLSDRIGSRKTILFPAVVVSAFCIAFVPVADGFAIFVLMVLAGMTMDGFMAISASMVLETVGVGPVYAGTALGFVFTIQQVGGIFAPPLGNSFESVNPALPFMFWASFSVIAFVALFFVRETGWRARVQAVASAEPSD